MTTPNKFEIYRVTESRTICGQTDAPKVLCEGMDLQKFREKYPRKRTLKNWSNDDMSESYRFEGKNSDTDWISCTDPR